MLGIVATSGVVSWEAPASNPHIRRLQASSGSPAVRLKLNVNVVKLDSFGSEPPKIDLSFYANGTQMQAYFPGTSGNSGRYLPMSLRQDMMLEVIGYRETDASAMSEQKAEMIDQGLAAGQVLGSTSEDTRPVFVVQGLQSVKSSAGASGRRLAGNASPNLEVVVVLVEPCGISLKDETTQDRLESAFFSPYTGSFSQLIGECSRGQVTVSGVVKGPIQICPTSNNPYSIYQATDKYLASDAAWRSLPYKVMVLPDSYLSSIGAATMGGTLSWYREDYVQHPQIFMHEIGHNWLLHHSGAAFISQEYRDTSSAMGYCCSTTCYNFIQSWQLGFASYMDKELNIFDLAAGSSGSTLVTLSQLGVYRQAGIKIRTSSTPVRNGSADLPSYLVLSYRGTGGFDQHLLGKGWANKVQIHHWDGDRVDDSSATYLLHSISKGDTVVIKDTDRVSQRLETGLKITVQGDLYDAGDTVNVLLCGRLGSDTDSNAAPCPDFIVATYGSTDVSVATTTAAGDTGATITRTGTGSTTTPVTTRRTTTTTTTTTTTNNNHNCLTALW